ncbi:uncharacterized protein RSE6_15172 [Rhynchosporium secalis]|uniref:Uncharacterized protein n=1 Tax=Rhynchosporium secalis TaxID=38038 RepID=A0A1E1MWU2_RHYSE|nr:uncharacterized protein RSE6_15172 [Rhynchosporium secalis]
MPYNLSTSEYSDLGSISILLLFKLLSGISTLNLLLPSSSETLLKFTSGIWPISTKAGILKIREYKKNYKKRKADKIDTDNIGNKHPNTLKEALITPEAFLELLVQVHEAEAHAKFKVDDDKEVRFRFRDHYIEVVREYVDSEPELEVVLNWSNLKESESEGEDSDNRLINSIAENADFIGLSY